MNSSDAPVALLFAGDARATSTPALANTRLAAVADALGSIGLRCVPVVYADEHANALRTTLCEMASVLVWVNPIEGGRDRTVLDALLRDVAATGVPVSAHPDVIQAIGTKEVLHRTRAMPWGSDTRLYPTLAEFRTQFPHSLAEGYPRVLKQYRGNGGDGVWKVESVGATAALNGEQMRVRVRHAQRGSDEYTTTLAEFMQQCEVYFAGAGRLIDQAYQPRLVDGMLRCYLAGDRVVGFGEQKINALFPGSNDLATLRTPPSEPGPRLYYPPTRPDLQRLKGLVEQAWVPQLCQLTDLPSQTLPIIWDIDLLYGPKDATGEDTYVLCEINVSCVFPFPDHALPAIAELVRSRVDQLTR